MFVLGSWIADFVVVIVVLCFVFYFWLTANYGYWNKKGIPCYTGDGYAGMKKTLTGKFRFPDMLEEAYVLFKDQGYGGIFHVRDPVLLVCKPELIKHVLTKDFSSFHDRGLPHDEKVDPFSANLVNLGGVRWKTLRAKLSPTFTSGKIKGMFPLIQDVTKQLQDCLRQRISVSSSVELKELLLRFGTDVIGSCAFGINCGALKNPDVEFHKMGTELTKVSFTNIVRFVIMSSCPQLASFVTFKKLFRKTADFFTGLMEQTVQFRRENNVERNDFVDLMMKILDEEQNGLMFNLEIMTAQAFLFFTAGLDGIANTIGFCLHELAKDADLQEKVHCEIETVLTNHGGKMSYDALEKMDLVARCIDETLRMYNPAPILMRQLTGSNYVLPGTNVELEKGIKVMVPIQALFNDEEHFPNPKKFDPDRFAEEEKEKRHQYAYIPFGEGPRFCIAARFAKVQMRLCLAELMRQFRFSIAPETDLSLELDSKYFPPTPKKGFWLIVNDRHSF